MVKDGDGETGASPELAPPHTSRTCSACELCCTVMAVRELGKPPARRCSLISPQGGCGAWGAHPSSCKSFTCLWLRSDDILPPEMFPLACGFLLALDQTEAWPTAVKVCVDPGRPTAWDQPRHRALFVRLAASWNCPVVVMDSDGRGKLAFAPSGRIFERSARPDIFPLDGRALAVPADDYGPDRRSPAQRIAAAGFRWAD